MTSPATHSSAFGQRYARLAGVLLLLSLVFGSFGEMYVGERLTVWTDAAATAGNIIASNGLFRLGFVSYLVEAVCDVVLAWAFYVLLRPVRPNVALLTAFLGLVSTALYGVAETFYFVPTLLLGRADYLTVFTHEQLSAAALLSLKLFGNVGGIFLVFYGVASVLRGYLIARSRYLPRVLGLLLGLGGIGFIVQDVLIVLSPASASGFLLLPMIVAMVSLMLWLLVRGVEGREWEEMAREGALA
ncbi:MAG TPA: DUF4386 domain-containing protein [Methylomirabilota bacterium]|nr:DUF4386 domain-containing protein [Methylomirabilota bacterium]